MLNREDAKKINRQVVLTRIGMNLLITIAGFIILYMFFNSMYPRFINFKNHLFVVAFRVLIVYVIIKNIINYKNLMEYLSRNYAIMEIRNSANAKDRFYFFALMYLEKLEISKTKLDIMKSLTPIPIIVFLLGVLIDIEFSILGEWLTTLINDVKSFNFNVKQSIILISFVLIFYYLNEYRSAWSAYKYNLREYYAFKYEYDIIEDRDTESSTR